MNGAVENRTVLFAEGTAEDLAQAHARALFGNAVAAPAVLTSARSQAASEPWIFMAEPDETKLQKALDASVSGCIETSRPEALPTELASLDDTHHLVVALTTRSAYHMPVARLFTMAILRRAGLPEDRMDMELAVHEAYSNGIIHGNLEMGSELRDNLEAYTQFASQLEQRLREDDYAGRYITLSGIVGEDVITIRITDQGLGYDVQHSPDAKNDRKHGRGLGIIAGATRGISITDGGRTIIMTFAKNEEDADNECH